MRALKSFLYRSFREGTWISSYTIMSAAGIGVLGHFGFYFLFKYYLLLPYENFALRLTATILCVVPWLVERFKVGWFMKYMPVYWHIALIFVLPFTFTVNLLKNDFHELWLYWEIFMLFVLIIHTPHWFIFLADLLIGLIAATVFFACTSSFSELTFGFDVLAFLIVFGFSIVAGLIFQASNKKLFQDNERNVRAGMTDLAKSIAHEMRNPLNQLELCLRVVKNELPIPNTFKDDVKQSITTKTLNTIYENISKGQLSITRGSQIITTTLADVEGKPTDPSQFIYLEADLTARKAFDEHAYKDGEKEKVKLIVNKRFIFKGDETTVLFVFFNLMKNALYYFEKKPEATLTITVDDHCIRLRDTGVGIPQHRLSGIFDSFQTVGKVGGTGVGLPYCKRQMQAMGGDITCESEEGKYTEFTLHFPVIPPGELHAYQTSVLESAKKCFEGKRFLVADDIEGNRTATKARLQGLGLQFGEAATGQEAIDELRQNHYDLVLMDLDMPVLDGYAAAEKIRKGAVPGKESVPIVAYTTESAYLARVKTEKVGMEDFISKPFSRLEFIRILQRALVNAQKEKTLAQAGFSLKGKNVLVVNDEQISRQLMRLHLLKKGMVVHEASDGSEVLAKLDAVECDLILMDMEMPEINGLEATRLVRKASASYSSVPIIMVTGHSDESSKEEAKAAGAQDFICAPIKPEIIYQKISAVLFKGPPTGDHSIQPIAVEPSKTSPDHQGLLDIESVNDYLESGVLPRLVELFAQDSKKWLAAIAQAKQVDDIHEAKKVLHSFKGNSGNIGAQTLFGHVASAYDFLLAGKWPTEPNWLDQLEALNVKTLDAFQAYLSSAQE